MKLNEAHYIVSWPSEFYLSGVTQVWPQSQGLDIAVLFPAQMQAIMEGKKKIIIFLMLMILVWVPNLKSKSRNDLEVSIFLITAFNQISFFQISWQMHIFPCWNLTFHSLHILCSESLFTFLLSQCKWNNCKLQFWGGQMGWVFFSTRSPQKNWKTI